MTYRGEVGAYPARPWQPRRGCCCNRHDVAAVAALKSQARTDLQIIGSGNLIQTLQAGSLIDEY
jgi:dihydrofolate reductase